jgi:hypothetical protein
VVSLSNRSFGALITTVRDGAIVAKERVPRQGSVVAWLLRLEDILGKGEWRCCLILSLPSVNEQRVGDWRVVPDNVVVYRANRAELGLG